MKISQKINPNGKKKKNPTVYSIPVDLENQKSVNNASRALTRILRHDYDHQGGPGPLMDNFYLPLDDVINCHNLKGLKLTRHIIAQIVNSDTKKRFSVLPKCYDPCTVDGCTYAATQVHDQAIDDIEYIKCNQGHSTNDHIKTIKDYGVNGIQESEYANLVGERYIFHGTNAKALESIRKTKMISSMNRQDVHFARSLPLDTVARLIGINNPIFTADTHIPNNEKLSGIRGRCDCVIVIDLVSLLAKGDPESRWRISPNGVVLYCDKDKTGVPTKYINGVFNLENSHWQQWENGSPKQSDIL